MMDIDKRVRQFVPDYPLYVIDMGHEAGFQFKKIDSDECPTARLILDVGHINIMISWTHNNTS